MRCFDKGDYYKIIALLNEIINYVEEGYPASAEDLDTLKFLIDNAYIVVDRSK